MKASQAVAALAALAHEQRLTVYRMLVEAGPEGLPAGAISTRLKVPPSSMTFHLQALQRAGLVTQERMSRQLIYTADFAVMNGLVGYLTENCCAQSASAGTCGAECAPAAARPSTSRKIRRSA
jgi:ArsR family transcriptional regulator